MVFIIQIVLAALGATLFLLLLYIFLKKHEQKKKRNKRIKTVSSIMGGDQKVPFIIEEHISRTYVLYYSYVVHTALNMFCKILGLIFSVASLIWLSISFFLSRAAFKRSLISWRSVSVSVFSFKGHIFIFFSGNLCYYNCICQTT